MTHDTATRERIERIARRFRLVDIPVRSEAHIIAALEAYDKEITALCEEMEREKWQNISTAPKDGTAVLLYWPRAVSFGADCIEAGRWSEERACWTSYNDDPDSDWCNPQFWQPLPQPPST